MNTNSIFQKRKGIDKEIIFKAMREAPTINITSPHICSAIGIRESRCSIVCHTKNCIENAVIELNDILYCSKHSIISKEKKKI